MTYVWLSVAGHTTNFHVSQNVNIGSCPPNPPVYSRDPGGNDSTKLPQWDSNIKSYPWLTSVYSTGN